MVLKINKKIKQTRKTTKRKSKKNDDGSLSMDIVDHSGGGGPTWQKCQM